MKSPEFYLLDLMDALWEEEAVPILERGYGEIFNSPLGRGPARNLKRIRAHTEGREPGPGELTGLLTEMAAIYVRHQIACNRIPSRPREYVDKTEVPAFAALKTLLERGQGALLVACHLEPTIAMLGAAALAHRHGVPVTVLTDFTEQYEQASKAIPTLRYLPMMESAAPCLAALRRNETVFFLGDIDFFPGERTAEFFGAPYHPPQGAAKLSLVAECPILPVYGLSESGAYCLRNEPPIETGGGRTQEAVEERLLRAFERIIGRHPAHWLVLRDAWDLDASSRAGRRLLQRLKFRRRLRDLWKPASST